MSVSINSSDFWTKETIPPIRRRLISLIEDEKCALWRKDITIAHKIYDYMGDIGDIDIRIKGCPVVSYVVRVAILKLASSISDATINDDEEKLSSIVADIMRETIPNYMLPNTFPSMNILSLAINMYKELPNMPDIYIQSILDICRSMANAIDRDRVIENSHEYDLQVHFLINLCANKYLLAAFFTDSHIIKPMLGMINI